MSLRVENASESSVLGSIVNRIQTIASALYDLARRVASAVWNIFTCRCSRAVSPPIPTQTPVGPSAPEDQRNLPPSEQARMVAEASRVTFDEARAAITASQTVGNQARAAIVAGEAVIAQATAVLGGHQAPLAQERMVLEALQASSDYARARLEASEASSDLGKAGTDRDAQPLETASSQRDSLTARTIGLPTLEVSSGSTPSSEIHSEVSLGSVPVGGSTPTVRGTTLGGPSSTPPIRPSREHIPVKSRNQAGETEGDEGSSGASTPVSTPTQTVQKSESGSRRANRKKNNKGSTTKTLVPVASKSPTNGSNKAAQGTTGGSSASQPKLPSSVQKGGVGSAINNSGLDPSQFRGTLKSREGHTRTPIPVSPSLYALASEVEGFELDPQRTSLALIPTGDVPSSGANAIVAQSETSTSDGKKVEEKS